MGEFAPRDGVSLHFLALFTSDGFEESVYMAARTPERVSARELGDASRLFPSLPLVKLLTAFLPLLSSRNTPGKR